MINLDNYLKHTIIVIRDVKNISGKITENFLLYFDEEWDCYFFPNLDNVDLKDDIIKEKLGKILYIPSERINNIEKLGSLLHEKEKNGKRKKYYHDFVLVDIDNYSIKETGTSFGRLGIEFTWLTLEEMKENEKIRRRNLDIVEFLEDIFSFYMEY